MPTSLSRERYVQAALSEKLVVEQNVGELSHLPLGAIAAALLWPTLPRVAIGTWFLVLVAATGARILVRRRVTPALRERGHVPFAFRASIVALAAVWGTGVLLAAQFVPHLEIALLLLMISGLTAAATSSLLADPATYAAYTGTLLLLSAVGVMPLLAHRAFVVAFCVIILYGLVMAALYRRLRLALVQSLITQFELEQSRASVDLERAFLNQLLESAPNPIVILDGTQRVQRTNPAFVRVFGYTEAEALGVRLDDLIVPAEERVVATEIQQRVATGETVQIEARRRRKDGALLDVRIAGANVGRTDGTFVVYDDITDRKLAEQTLRESEARLFRTLASLPVGILVIDVDGVSIFANDAARSMIGAHTTAAEPMEALARAYGAFIAGTTTPYPANRLPILRALRGEESFVDDIEVQGPDGPVTVEVFGSPIRDAQGNVMFGVAAFTDITERRRVAAALQAARIAAEEATAAKSSFLANMSHEIRTPLNGILGLAELLLADELSREQRRSLELILSSGETLLHVLNDILDFSKIEAGQVDIESVAIDLTSIAESTARLLMPRAVEKSIEIVTEIDRRVPPGVLGDPTRIRQVLTNLVGNAVKFTDRGEVVVALSVVSQHEGRARIRFDVRDTGPGIPDAKRDAIFDAFRQADATTTRRYGGTGLGLSISRRLVELMGGTLTLDSTVGAGSTFSVELELPVVEAARPADAAAESLADLRVLIVDDNATNRRVMRGTLEGSGCTVSEAAGGREALEALRVGLRDRRPFELLVTDLVMPDLDGFELVSSMREDAALAATPAVMVTSINRRGDAQRCRELGIRAFLTKPASRVELLDAVRTAVTESIRVQPSPSPAAPPTRDESIADPARRPLDVLLAEDNAVNQEVAAAMLRRRGHRVMVADNGRAAVALAAEHRFDVVLMDLQMPELDGLEATAEIRAHFGGGGPRIVAVTANALTGERERCLAAGMDGYLSKPFRSTDLVAVVEHRGTTPAIGVPIVPAAPQPVDLRSLQRDLDLGGVGEIFDGIIDVFMRDAPPRMDAVRAAVASADPHAMERAAHAFKSAAATIHAGALADMLHALERSARAGSVADAADRLAALEQEFAAVRRQLKSRDGDERHD